MPAFEFSVEYAKSGRSGCKKCKGKIEKDSVRLGMRTESDGADHLADATKWHHFECFQSVRASHWFKKNLPDAAESLAGFDALKEEDQQRVRDLFAACRGEGVSDVATPQAKRQKTSDSKPPFAQGVLTDDELAAVLKAMEELKGKAVAQLAAMLGKNGLAKTGKKDELIERVAEAQVLGVPPKCTTCDKVRLKWARSSGKFSCPGYFDDEDKAFKRCKGIDKDAIVTREAWKLLDD